jgi:hypothetical protein
MQVPSILQADSLKGDASGPVSNRQSSFGMKCLKCSNELIAPEWSEYRNERQVRHSWHCWDCDFCFESVVSFPAVTMSMRNIKRRANMFPSLLVA